MDTTCVTNLHLTSDNTDCSQKYMEHISKTNNAFGYKENPESSQDRGIGRPALPPHKTTNTITIKSQNK